MTSTRQGYNNDDIYVDQTIDEVRDMLQGNVKPITVNNYPTGQLINIFMNGDWDTSHEDRTDKSPIRVFNKGEHVQILKEQYDEYIDALEEKGFDCYLCPEMYAHPQWNGEIIFL